MRMYTQQNGAKTNQSNKSAKINWMVKPETTLVKEVVYIDQRTDTSQTNCGAVENVAIIPNSGWLKSCFLGQ